MNQPATGATTQWIINGAAAVAIASTVAAGGFWVGTSIAKSQAATAKAQDAATEAKLRGNITKLQLQIQIAQEHEASAIKANHQWESAYSSLQNELSQESTKVSKLATQLGKDDNCSFIHKQLVTIEQQLQGAWGTGVFESSNEWKQQQVARKARLEAQLQGYQQQLGSCNR